MAQDVRVNGEIESGITTKFYRPVVEGRWMIVDDEGNDVALMRVATSTNPNFALGQRLLQVFNNKLSQYDSFAFIQDNGAMSPYKSRVGSPEVSLGELMMQLLEEGEGSSVHGYTYREVHRDPKAIEKTKLGKALNKWAATAEAKRI